jgi:hypothetical protein
MLNKLLKSKETSNQKLRKQQRNSQLLSRRPMKQSLRSTRPRINFVKNSSRIRWNTKSKTIESDGSREWPPTRNVLVVRTMTSKPEKRSSS